MGRLVLASTSPYRRALLDRLGLAYTAAAPRCDEAAYAALGLPPDELATTLARTKAESVRGDFPDALVIGSDQLLDLDGEVLGKPHTVDGARAQLARLAGRTHRLVTAVAVAHPDGRVDEHLEVHRMTLRPLSTDEIARYVEADRPLDCAGSYRIERLGITLFERIDGHDFTAIEGLPLVAVARILRASGLALP